MIDYLEIKGYKSIKNLELEMKPINILIGSNGVGKSNLIAKNNAIAAANTTCGKKATAVIIDEKTEYNGALKGVVDEQTGQMIQAAASVIGTLAGKNGSLARDEDYQTTLTFKCRAN